MKPNHTRRNIFYLMAVILLLGGSILTRGQSMAAAQGNMPGTLFVQPVDTAGKLFISSKRDPDGSGNDKYVWDNFTLQAAATITEIQWVGGFDPLRNGGGGPVFDFRASIYPSIAADTEPAVANPPLAQYSSGGNAAQTAIGMVGAIPMYSYTYTLPEPFAASAGVKYWIQIQAFQQGSIPDWGIASAIDGNNSHYVRESGAGGDLFYHTVPGDAAFTLIGLSDGTLIVFQPVFLPFVVR